MAFVGSRDHVRAVRANGHVTSEIEIKGATSDEAASGILFTVLQMFNYLPRRGARHTKPFGLLIIVPDNAGSRLGYVETASDNFTCVSVARITIDTDAAIAT